MEHNRSQITPLLPSDRRHVEGPGSDNSPGGIRGFLRRFLVSKYGHYFVIILVTLDVCGIFADFLIKLHICEHSGKNMHMWKDIDEALDILSLVFSCLFMVELLCSIYAFGFRYFTSKFHIFDAMSIIASFLVDVLTHGPVEEAGSLIIVLRLFRVFKIIQESSTVAEETLNELHEKIEELEKENSSLRRRHGYTSVITSYQEM